MFAATLLAVAVAAPPREPMDEHIDRGLSFLRKNQLPDGGWGQMGGGLPGFGGNVRGGSDPALTALAVMAFLSAGHSPGEGRHGQAIDAGIRYVMNSQQNNGLFSGPFAGNTEMYYHGICTLMLAEAAGQVQGPWANELRQRLEAAVAVVLAGQRTGGIRGANGGWRYQVRGVDADLSVTGWQMMALRGAKNLGCDVPQERIRAAVNYVLTCHDPQSGGFRYTAHGNLTVPCTGTGILAIELCGKEYHKCKEVLQAGAFVLRTRMSPQQPHFFYGVYYTSQGMFQLGDNYWKSYRQILHNLLFVENPQQASGAWVGRGGFDDVNWGPCYCTAMAILALTVEYRYLPIYQRFEEPIEADPDK